VDALDAGGDDHVTKPFAVEEVLAGPRAPLRTSQPGDPTPAVLEFDGLEIDLGQQLVTLAGERFHLATTEHALLEALATNPASYSRVSGSCAYGGRATATRGTTSVST
jgi:two-component system KDP operon response regulator KdpE